MLVVRENDLLFFGECPVAAPDDSQMASIHLVLRGKLQNQINMLDDHVESLVLLAKQYRLNEQLLDGTKDMVDSLKEALLLYEPRILDEMCNNGNQHSMLWDELQKMADEVFLQLTSLEEHTLKDWAHEKSQQCQMLHDCVDRITLLEQTLGFPQHDLWAALNGVKKEVGRIGSCDDEDMEEAPLATFSLEPYDGDIAARQLFRSF